VPWYLFHPNPIRLAHVPAQFTLHGRGRAAQTRAIRRMESPRSTPAKISSRSAKDKKRALVGTVRKAGITPPA
jgi:hypothetical protein